MQDTLSARADPAGNLYGARVIAPGATVDGIGTLVAEIALRGVAGPGWRIACAGALGLAILGFAAGVAGSGRPLAGPIGLAAYEFWFGLASGSLLLTAVLRLAGAEWHAAIGRVAEAVALACACAAMACAAGGMTSATHGGTTPAAGGAVSAADLRSVLAPHGVGGLALLVVSLCAWSIGLLPDLAVLRGRAIEAATPAVSASIAGAGKRSDRLRLRLVAGWRGSAGQWRSWIAGSRAIALLGVIVVVAATAEQATILAATVPAVGTLLPVSLLVGAVLSGLGCVAALAAGLRSGFGLHDLITARHLDILARTMLAAGIGALYCRAGAIGTTLLRGDDAALSVLARRLAGDGAWTFWAFVAGTLLPVQLFWLGSIRRSGLAIGLIGTLLAAGIGIDLYGTMLGPPQAGGASSAAAGSALVPASALFLGTAGIAVLVLLLHLRFLPVVSIAETRRLAIAHNPGAVPAAGTAPAEAALGRVPCRSVSAAFSSEKALAAAVAALDGRDARIRVDGCGPVPMPDVAEWLGGGTAPLRIAAIGGALLGGFGFLALMSGHRTGVAFPLVDGQPPLAWPFLFMPSLAAAAMTGALAVVAALIPRMLERQAGTVSCEPSMDVACFVLTAALPEGADPRWIERRLIAHPDTGLRPIAIRREPS